MTFFCNISVHTQYLFHLTTITSNALCTMRRKTWFSTLMLSIAPSSLSNSLHLGLEALPRLVRFRLRPDLNNIIAVLRQEFSVEFCKLVVPGPKHFHTIVCRSPALQKPNLRQHTRTIEEKHRRRRSPASQGPFSCVSRARKSIKQDGSLLLPATISRCFDYVSNGLGGDGDYGVGW